MAWGRERIQKQILQKVSSLLLRGLNDPRLGMVNLTRVELSRDRSMCKVFWSTLEEGGRRSRIEHALEAARGFVQREVAGILRTRTAPRLEFRFDASVEGIERLSRLLREASPELEVDADGPADRDDEPEARQPAADDGP